MKKLVSLFFSTLCFLSFSQIPTIDAVGGESTVDWKSQYEEYQKEFGDEGPGFILGGCSQGLRPSKASSTLTSQGNSNYGVKNLQDDNPMSAWVEGKSDYGIGEYFEVIGVGVNTIYNGYQKSASAFKNNSRVKKFKVYKNGTPLCFINLQDKMGAQSFEMPDANGGELNWDNPDTYKFEIVEVYKGLKWKDVAISEIDYVMCCFTASTLIAGPLNEVSATNLDGSVVTTLDLSSGLVNSAVVELSTEQIHFTIYAVSTADYAIEITPDHPIYFKEYGFMSIGDLMKKLQIDNAGDLVGNVEILVWNSETQMTEFQPLKKIEQLKGEFKTYTILEMSEGTTFVANGFITKTY